MRLYIDKKNSRWGIEHEKRDFENGSSKINHWLKAEVKYEDEKGEVKKSYSRIRIADEFFFDQKIDDNGEKKTKTLTSFADLEPMNNIMDILKPNTFEVESIPYNAAVGKKQHMSHSIIPVSSTQADDEDYRVLVLGGFSGDRGVFFESNASKNKKGKGVVLTFAKSKGRKSDEQIKKEAEIKGGEDKVDPTFVRAVQFAALLEHGDMVAYRVFEYNKKFNKVICRVQTFKNDLGIITPKSYSMREWNATFGKNQ